PLFNQCIVTKDGGILAAGNTNGKGPRKSLLIKYDSLGNIPTASMGKLQPVTYSIWPNPTHSGITINGEMGIKVDVKLFNINGHLVYESRTKSLPLHLDLKSYNIARGIYFVQITGGQNVFRSKIQ